MRRSLRLQKVTSAGGPGRACGFSLVELMITIAVAAILLVIAVPSFNYIINSNRLTTAANALVNSLNNARIAAIQRNASVQFCSNSSVSNTTADALGTACGTNTAVVLALTSPGASTTTPVLAAPTVLAISSIQIHGTIQAIRFNSFGQGFLPGTATPFDSSALGNGSTPNGPVVDVCSTALTTNNHIQVNMAAGTVISTSPSSGVCP